MTDIWTQLEKYRQVKVLPSGLRTLLRPLGKGDEESLTKLFERAAPAELARFQSQPPTRETVDRWIEKRDLRKVFPLIVLTNNRVIGQADIHFGEKFQRHLGWMRIFLDQEFRRRGIGTLMIRAAIEVARRVGLHQLLALVPADQPRVIRAFEHQGFKNVITHQDFAILHDGHTLDVTELVLYMVDHTGEF